jgi:hypothetical protein
MNPSEIEPATFRIVASSLNDYAATFSIIEELLLVCAEEHDINIFLLGVPHVQHVYSRLECATFGQDVSLCPSHNCFMCLLLFPRHP